MKKYLSTALLTILFFQNSFSQIFDSTLLMPRIRVITDNDFSGDPDGLFQLAHLALSSSVEIRAVIGSHLRYDDGFDKSGKQADNAAAKANALLATLKLKNSIPVISGSNTAMVNDSIPVISKAVDFIIKEALRTDTKAPLYILCGAGLTEVASALLKAPQIADKFTLVWIGGPEYTDLASPPPHASAVEYNMNIDIAAARAIFNHSTVNLWQVPRNAYRQALISYSELTTKIKPHGKTGKFLCNELDSLLSKMKQYGLNLGETYILGDSPLALLTALQSPWEPDPSSSTYVVKKAPLINLQGNYEVNPNGRNIRVYNLLDTRLMFNDFFAKMELLN
jgi:purine nucleosidase